jgi:hypothetical protein
MNEYMGPDPVPARRARPWRVFAWFVFPAMLCWGTMAIVCSNITPVLRSAAVGAFCTAALISVFFPRRDGWKAGCFLFVFSLVLAWWLALSPGNDRDWQPDAATLSFAAVTGDIVTIHNIRNFDYRRENDYVVRHYDRTFDLRSLRSMDLFLVDWGLPHIAHTMLSFGFDGGEYVCFSIEVRKEKKERYSAIKGFFKQYELMYVVAAERDVVRLRANYRKGEDVYLYRLKVPPELIRKILLDYLRTVNGLKERPEWYNALTGNCTTGIWKHIAPQYPKAKFDWRLLASGHADEMAYELGVLDRTFPFRELRRRSLINARSKAAGNRGRFSELIRHGLPGFEEKP